MGRRRSRLSELLDELRDELEDDDDDDRRGGRRRRRNDDDDGEGDVITLRGPAARKFLGLLDDDGKDGGDGKGAGDDDGKGSGDGGKGGDDDTPRRGRQYFKGNES